MSITVKKKITKTPQYWLNSINRISTSFNMASRDIGAILNILTNKLKEELGVFAVAIWTVEEKTNFMKIEASAGISKGYLRYFNQTDRIRAGKGLVGKVMSGRKTLHTLNPKNEELIDVKRWRQAMLDEGFVAIISAPMFVGKKTVGAFSVYYKKHIPSINPYQIQFIEITANQIAVIIENIRGYNTIKTYGENLHDRVEKLTQLQKMTESFGLDFYKSIKKSLQTFSDRIVEQFNASGVSIFRWEKEERVLKMIASCHLSKNHENFLRKNPHAFGPGTLAGLAFQKREIQTSSKVFVDERIDKKWRILMSIEKKSAIAAFPLIVRNQGIGAVVVYYEKPHAFLEEEIGILSMMAQYIGISFMNVQVLDSLMLERQKMIFMINSLYDGLIVYDLDNKITAFNPRAEELFWVRSPEVMGQSPAELDTKKNSAFSNIKMIHELGLLDFEKREVNIINPDKKVLEITSVPLIGEGRRKEGHMNIIHDITKEKEAEWLKSSFVAVAGHQLRTPLSGVKWMLNMYQSGDFGVLNDVQKKYLQKGIDSVEHLIKTVQDLLDVSKLEDKRFAYKFVPVEVYRVAKDCFQEFLPIIEKTKMADFEFVFEEPSLSIPKAMVDPEKLRMAFYNIIDNAIKYTQRKGKIHVSLDLKFKSIIFTVEDDGIGIPESEQKYLFTRFFRASNAIRFRPAGSGLGLFIAKEIVTHFNGKIKVESEHEKGSTFTIVLPLAHSSSS